MANLEGKPPTPMQHSGSWYQSKHLNAGISGDRRSHLRRVVSMRALNTHLDSSESIPSEHSSLYDAILTSFESEHNERLQELGGDEQIGVSGTHPDTDSLAGSRTNTLDGPLWRSTWAATPLETIVEQQSISTMQLSSAKSVLRPRTSGGVSLIMKSSYSQLSAPRLLLQRRQYGAKIYPFDDLDIPYSRPKFSFSSLPGDRYHHTNQSSSSDGGFKTPEWIEEPVSLAGPIQPIYPPPIRTPTPPGFPSFGSPEALRYNSSAQANRNRQIARDNTRSLQQNKSTRNTILVGASDSESFSCCGFRLRHLFAIAPRPAPAPQLPPGVVARAEDGTLIRARFGARQSGHGVGSNPASAGLSSHPFHRRALPVARIKENEFGIPQTDSPVNTSHLGSRRSALRASSRPSLTPASEGDVVTPPPRIRIQGDSRGLDTSAATIPMPVAVRQQRGTNGNCATAHPTPNTSSQMCYATTACPISGTDGSVGDALPPSGRFREHVQLHNPPPATRGYSFGFFNFIQALFSKCCGFGRGGDSSENNIPLRQYGHRTSVADGNDEGPAFQGRRRRSIPRSPTWGWNPCLGR